MEIKAMITSAYEEWFDCLYFLKSLFWFALHFGILFFGFILESIIRNWWNVWLKIIENEYLFEKNDKENIKIR